MNRRIYIMENKIINDKLKINSVTKIERFDIVKGI